MPSLYARLVTSGQLEWAEVPRRPHLLLLEECRMEGRLAADARSLRSLDARSGLSLGESTTTGGGGGAIHARSGSLSGIVAEEVGSGHHHERENERI
jgi:hypothetical protein